MTSSALPIRQDMANGNPEVGPIPLEHSFSSFPASRAASAMSQTRMPTRSPAPPSTNEPYRGSDGSSKAPSSTGVSSEISAASIHRHGPNHVPPTKRKKLKSQYPRDDPEDHVEYILVASFHVDRGPIMEHQYPGAISGDEHMLAELMLPDQAHVRNQDWTIFFLHKDTSGEEDSGAEVEEKEPKRRGRRGLAAELEEETESGPSDESNGSESNSGVEDSEAEDAQGEDEDGEAKGVEGPPLIYVLNLVNTKQDTTAKRGAVVKAMAICTRHSFLHIYKPLLLLALEEYFRSPYPETLKDLYDAVNSMDLSLMPRLSTLERHILQASDTKDMFVEKFERMIQQRMAEERQQKQLIEMNDPSSPPKAGTPALYNTPRDTHEFETRVIYNAIPIPIKVPTAISPETVGDFSLIQLIQAFSVPHAKDPQPFMLHSHLTTSGAYTHPIIVLVNAMLTQKRVIFLGHNRPSGEVAEAVLAACALASGGVLRGFTRHAFPYTDLSKIDDLLKVPGFVAGVTNPAFANKPEWWDLLCDIPTGRMKISNRIEPPTVTEGLVNFQQQNNGFHNHHHPSGTSNSSSSSGSATSVADPIGDQAFMEDILRSIANRHGEAVIRAKWRDWVVKFTRIAAAFEESVYGASALYIGGDEADAGYAGVQGHGYVWADDVARQRELAGAVHRIEGWRNTRSYYSYIQDLASLYLQRPLKKLDLQHHHDILRTRKLSSSQSASIFFAFSHSILSPSAIHQLLTVTPEAHAGLFYISLGLFHPDREVREGVVGLLERIRADEAGRHFWAGVGRFAKCAFLRLRREMDAAAEAAAGVSIHLGVGGGGPVGGSEHPQNVGIDGRIRGTGRAS